jgi:hypothetical protein
MVRPEVTGRKVAANEALALSIADFCRAHDISESMYFKMRTQGLGPREMIVGARKLISREAAQAWRREREVETASTTINVTCEPPGELG